MKSRSVKIKLTALAAAAALILGFAAMPRLTASANSAPKNWSGGTSSGLIVTDENCPVQVESEVLTFDISEFPHNYYDYADDFLDYGASVTASYTFCNPADYDVDMTLVFPFGEYPSYYVYGSDDTAKYTVTADGEEVERSLRYTYSAGGFEAARDVAKITDGYREDAFYSPDMPVYKYAYSVGGTDGDTQIYFGLNYDKTATRVFYGIKDYSDPYALSLYRSGNYIGHVRSGDLVYIFAVGKDFNSQPEIRFQSEYEIFSSPANGTASLTEKSEITFKELALAYYRAADGVSETDWYNASLDSLKELGVIYEGLSRDLMRWYEYSLSIPAHGRVVNEVTAPVYPDINGYFSPEKYTYQYLLSPAQCWAEFGSLKIKINTPYYLLYNSIGGFEKTEEGYELTLDGLPEGELGFTLCASENPKSGWDGFLSGLKIFAAILAGLQVFVAIVLVIVFAATGQFSSKPKSKKL